MTTLQRHSEISGWRKFLVAYSVTISGERIADLAIPLTSLAVTGGLQLAGLYIAATSIPKFLIGPLLSPLIRRSPRRSWCSYGNWMQAAAFALLCSFVLTGVSESIAFILAGLLAGTGAGIFGLTAQATIRSLLPDRKVSSANSSLEVVDSLFTLGVPLAAGLLVDWLGPGPVLAITALAFGGAALLRTGLWVEQNPAERDKVEEHSSVVSYRVRLLETIVSPFGTPVRSFVSIGSLLLASSSILLIPIASAQISQLDGNAFTVGIAISAAGAGGLIASVIAGRAKKTTLSTRWTAAITIAMIVSVPVIFSSSNLVMVIVLVGVSDALASWLYVAYPTIRMLNETSTELVPITAGMMTFGSIFTLLIGLGLSTFSSGNGLLGFALVISVLFLVLFCAICFFVFRKKSVDPDFE